MEKMMDHAIKTPNGNRFFHRGFLFFLSNAGSIKVREIQNNKTWRHKNVKA
jgi:hypothetical protein